MRASKIFIALILFTFILFLQSCKNDTTTNSGSTSANMTKVGQYDSPGLAEGITVYQIGNVNFGFIADGTNGLQTINVTLPGSPSSISNISTSGNAINVNVTAIGNSVFAFVSCFSQGLDIKNVSNPVTPHNDTVLSFVNDHVLCSYIDSSTKRVYIGTYNGFMYIYNIASLPGPVTLLGTYTTGTEVHSIQVTTGGLAYLAEGNIGMEIVNVSNPATPAYVGGFLSNNLFVYDVKVFANYAYLAAGNRMITLNISVPSSPQFVSAYSNSNAIFYSLSVINGTVFTAEGTNGVESIGVGTPQTPVQVGFYKTGDNASDVFYFNGYLFVADGSDGIIILKPS